MKTLLHLLQNLFDKFILKTSSDKLGAINVSDYVEMNFPITKNILNDNNYASKNVIAPCNGTVVLWGLFLIDDADIRSYVKGYQYYTMLSPNGKWLAIHCPVQKGLEYSFSIRPTNTEDVNGTAKITFFKTQKP